MLMHTEIAEGYNIIHAGGLSYLDAMTDLVQQVRALEKAYEIDFISNASCKCDEGKMKEMYHAVQTVILKTKKPVEVPKQAKAAK